MSSTDPLTEAREALRQAQSDLYNANAYFSGAKIEPILARLDTLPAAVRFENPPPLRVGTFTRKTGWFLPDPDES